LGILDSGGGLREVTRMRKEHLAAHLKANAGEFLGLLIAGDLLLIGLHLLHIYSKHFSDIGFASTAFAVTVDGSLGETYQYLKMFWIVLLLTGVSVRTGRLSYLSWALFFLYLLLDDSLQLHERLGSMVVARMGYVPAFRLRAQDFGELTVVGSAGLFFACLLAFTWWRGDQEFRRVFRGLALLVGVVLLFGVGVDMLHPMVDSSSLKTALGLLEDGGEMVAMSFVCWYTYRVFLQQRTEGSAEAGAPSPPPSPA
jgi:hypothetical protein